MPKLVILSAGMTGWSHELKADKTTIGRVEDNTFPLTEPSVSSHHCEVLLRGAEIVVRDLNSTNGTFINGEKVTETVIKPGQMLRLCQGEMRLETESPASATKKPADSTLVMQRGVSLNELEQGKRGGLDTPGKGFSKQDNKANKIFWMVVIGVGVVIVGLLVFAFATMKGH